MNLLQEILDHKRKEVAGRKELYPAKLLEQSIYYRNESVSLKKYLRRSDLAGVIAEIKRKSPSRGYLNKYLSIEDLSVGYMQAGASALSVLTDEKYFAGTAEDLTIARRFNFCPILRKDFILDEYQIIEAKALGADAILLIAAALSASEVRGFSQRARNLGLEVLLEVHTKEELDSHLCESIDVVGVNNRDLNDFSVDLARSFELLHSLPADTVKISESGIVAPQDAARLKTAGFDGFLIGETFLRSSKPEVVCADFIKGLLTLLKPAQASTAASVGRLQG
jgi:indole-3-glycerol phosphate synthase